MDICKVQDHLRAQVCYFGILFLVCFLWSKVMKCTAV